MSILERPQGRNYFSSEMVSQGPSYDNVFFKKVYNTEIGVTHTHTHTHTQRGCNRDIKKGISRSVQIQDATETF